MISWTRFDDIPPPTGKRLILFISSPLNQPQASFTFFDYLYDGENTFVQVVSNEKLADKYRKALTHWTLLNKPEV